jgi:hypothetical protein|tara:strand:+ start:1925 stop:2101 length:177 start_codon:yes stop_codon:yes gene_type:complete
MKAQQLSKFIDQHYNGSRSAFATDNDVDYSQVRGWLKRDMIVVDGVLHSSRKKLATPL